MRYESCLTCRVPGLVDEGQRLGTALAESLGPFTHHHHAVKCGQCGRWWFDDVLRGAFGQPVAARRDTEMCGCPEGPPIYTPMTIQIPQPESECACTKASVDALPIQAEAYPADVALRKLTDPEPPTV